MRNSNFSDQFSGIFDMVKHYISLRFDYLKLNVAEYLIRFFSSIALWMVMLWIFFFALVFGSFAFAYWFGEMTGKMWLGFLIVAGFYLILSIVIYGLRRSIIVRPFTRMILSEMELDKFKEESDEKE